MGRSSSEPHGTHAGPAREASPGSRTVERDRTGSGGGPIFVLWDNGEIYDHNAGTLLRTGPANRVGLLFGLPPAALPMPTVLGDFWAYNATVALPVPVPPGATQVREPLSLAAFGPPLGFDVQWALPCAAAPAGYVLTDGLQVEVSR